VSYTPHVSRFAAGSAIVDNFQLACEQSGPSYASLFSGCQADLHGVFEHPRKLSDNILLISEWFARDGYDVYFWGEHQMANYNLNYGQGVHPDKAFSYKLEAHDTVFKNILNKISSKKNYKAFIMTNFTVTHGIYPPVNINHLREMPDQRQMENFWSLNCLPDDLKASGLTADELDRYGRLLSEQKFLSIAYEFDELVNRLKLNVEEKTKFIKTIEYTYKVDIARLDRLFGRVINKIEEQNLLDNSLIVFTADHGETMHREGIFFKYNHGYELAPEVLTVPLIIRGPSVGISADHYTPVVRSIDLFPTVAGLCEIPVPQKYGLQGIDLSSFLKGLQRPPLLPAYSHTCLIHYLLLPLINQWPILSTLYPDRDPELMWVSVRYGDEVFKWAKYDLNNPVFKPSMFNLKSDAYERNNLFDASNEKHQKVIEDLKAYKMRLVDACKEWDKKAGGISEEERINRLQSLGYLQ
jgi:arylsulfatase A-like enzyme